MRCFDKQFEVTIWNILFAENKELNKHKTGARTYILMLTFRFGYF